MPNISDRGTPKDKRFRDNKIGDPPRKRLKKQQKTVSIRNGKSSQIETDNKKVIQKRSPEHSASRQRLLMGNAMDGTEPPDQVGAVHADHLSVGKALLKHVERLSIP